MPELVCDWRRWLVIAAYLLTAYSLPCIPPSGDQSQNVSQDCASFFCRDLVPYLASLFHDLKITDILLAVFTLALAVYTRSLDKSTRKLWEAGERQIALAREEFNTTHRPRVRVRHFDIHFTEEGKLEFHPSSKFLVSFHIVNVGDAPIKKIALTYVAGWSKSEAKILTQFGTSFKTEELETYLLPGGAISKTITPDFPDSDYLKLAALGGSGEFFVVGRILHVDASDVERVTGFFRKCPRSIGPAVQEFQVVPGNDYEYED